VAVLEAGEEEGALGAFGGFGGFAGGELGAAVLGSGAGGLVLVLRWFGLRVLGKGERGGKGVVHF